MLSGSYTDGSATEQSDVDVIIHSPPGNNDMIVAQRTVRTSEMPWIINCAAVDIYIIGIIIPGKVGIVSNGIIPKSAIKSFNKKVRVILDTSVIMKWFFNDIDGCLISCNSIQDNIYCLDIYNLTIILTIVDKICKFY